jgi:hypothetical protein
MSTFVVSPGPEVYGKVVLPDYVVMTELVSDGWVFRTDVNDRACRRAPVLDDAGAGVGH